MTLKQVLDELRSRGNASSVEGMKRYNIRSVKAFGVSAPNIRTVARSIGCDHKLALLLWKSGFHEAKILAAIIADPLQADLLMLDRWAGELENWAQCDSCCIEYFQKTTFAYDLPGRWSNNTEEFVRRAGIVMIAVLAVHHKKAPDKGFEQFFPLLKKYSTDERLYVKKAVNWSLRQIGKRNMRLHKKAIALAKEIQNIPSPSARWIAADALRELQNDKTIAMIQRKKEYI
jgi:3-methyladenine DNA glycosylase AlkD